jgi:RNA polymerase sigma-70 factor, ECF subfamily
MLSFEDMYLAYSPDVYRFAFWLSGDSGEAEDITSDTFVRAWMNFATIRTETLKAYLFTIARNIYLEGLRRRHDHHSLKESHPDSRTKLERMIEDRSELDEIRSTLQNIAEIDRSAFVLRVQYDLPYAEIARVLKLSEGAAKVKVHRARKKLFSDYQERNSDE